MVTVRIKRSQLFEFQNLVWVWLNSPSGIYPYCGLRVLGNMWYSEYLGNIWYFNGKLQQFWHFLDACSAEIIRKLLPEKFSSNFEHHLLLRKDTEKTLDDSTIVFSPAVWSFWVEDYLDWLIKDIFEALKKAKHKYIFDPEKKRMNIFGPFKT